MNQFGMQLPGGQMQRGPVMNVYTGLLLLAVIASMYAVYHGPEGLTHIARAVHRRASVLAAGLRQLGFAPQTEAFFDTVNHDRLLNQLRDQIGSGKLLRLIGRYLRAGVELPDGTR